MSSVAHKLKGLFSGIPARRLPLFAGLTVFVLVAVVLMRSLPGPAPARPPSATSPTGAAAEAPLLLPAPPAATPAVTGQVSLNDFRLVIPPGWQRRPDLEEQGPGTKLFLAGPMVGEGQLYIGIDVYTLPHGMRLPDFIERYSAQWTGVAGLQDKPAGLCGQPARLLALSDGKVDKLFLVAVHGDRGYVIGMFGPTAQGEANVKAFKAVVNSFQFYG